LLQRIDGFSEYANKNQLQQDHPCVIRLIKEKYLRQPASKSLPYRLGDPQPLNPSDGPAQGILRILRNQVNLPLRVLFVCKFVLIFNFSFFKDQRIFRRMRCLRWRIPIQHAIHGAILPVERTAHRGRSNIAQSTREPPSSSLHFARLSQHKTLPHGSKSAGLL
jgi:hypothetical protein